MHEHTVLVVDDEDSLRECLGDVMPDENYGVVFAKNGREALDYLKRHRPPCLIVLDLMMPVMSGWDFLDRRCVDPALREIPVVVFTAGGQQDIFRLPSVPEISALVRKPEPFDLQRMVEAHCTQRFV